MTDKELNDIDNVTDADTGGYFSIFKKGKIIKFPTKFIYGTNYDQAENKYVVDMNIGEKNDQEIKITKEIDKNV